MNAYDVEQRTTRLGSVSARRLAVDSSLPVDAGEAKDIYFCAAELNGAGVRFYGDVALVLSKKRVPQDTVVLDRNSYDLERQPIVDRIRKGRSEGWAARRKMEAERLAGTWESDVASMAVIKVLDRVGGGERRLTTAQISDNLLDDEDYIEVLLKNSFDAGDVTEARLSAADAALDALTGDRILRGSAPSAEAVLWRRRRQAAEEALRIARIKLSVVTTTGRVKS